MVAAAPPRAFTKSRFLRKRCSSSLRHDREKRHNPGNRPCEGMGLGSFTNAWLPAAFGLLHCAGLASAEVHSIVGGQNASSDKEFPFFVRSSEEGLCGGVLVASDVVLSAAHCAPVFYNKLYVGSYNWRLDGKPNATSFRRTVLPGSRILHPNYDGTFAGSDLMLFKIAPVPIRRATLNLDPSTPVPGQKLTVVGFGNLVPTQNVPPEFPDTLQKATQVVVDVTTCRERWGTDAGVIDNRTMICANSSSSTTAASICGGDSGGPLMDGQRRVVGLASFGPLVCGVGPPAVYTRLSAFTKWLRESICELSDDASLPFCDYSVLQCPIDTTIVGWPAKLPNKSIASVGFRDFFIEQSPPGGTAVAVGTKQVVTLTSSGSGYRPSSCRWLVTNPPVEKIGDVRFAVNPGTSHSKKPVSFFYSVPSFGQNLIHVGTDYWIRRIYAKVVGPASSRVLRGLTKSSNVTVTLLTPTNTRTNITAVIPIGQKESNSSISYPPGVVCGSGQGVSIAVNGWGINSTVVVEVYLFGQKKFA